MEVDQRPSIAGPPGRRAEVEGGGAWVGGRRIGGVPWLLGAHRQGTLAPGGSFLAVDDQVAGLGQGPGLLLRREDPLFPPTQEADGTQYVVAGDWLLRSQAESDEWVPIVHFEGARRALGQGVGLGDNSVWHLSADGTFTAWQLPGRVNSRAWAWDLEGRLLLFIGREEGEERWHELLRWTPGSDSFERLIEVPGSRGPRVLYTGRNDRVAWSIGQEVYLWTIGEELETVHVGGLVRTGRHGDGVRIDTREKRLLVRWDGTRQHVDDAALSDDEEPKRVGSATRYQQRVGRWWAEWNEENTVVWDMDRLEAPTRIRGKLVQLSGDWVIVATEDELQTWAPGHDGTLSLVASHAVDRRGSLAFSEREVVAMNRGVVEFLDPYTLVPSRTLRTPLRTLSAIVEAGPQTGLVGARGAVVVHDEAVVLHVGGSNIALSPDLRFVAQSVGDELQVRRVDAPDKIFVLARGTGQSRPVFVGGLLQAGRGGNSRAWVVGTWQAATPHPTAPEVEISKRRPVMVDGDVGVGLLAFPGGWAVMYADGRLEGEDPQGRLIVSGPDGDRTAFHEQVISSVSDIRDASLVPVSPSNGLGCAAVPVRGPRLSILLLPIAMLRARRRLRR